MLQVHVNTTLKELSSPQILSILKEFRVKPELYIDGNEVAAVSEKTLRKIEENLTRHDLLPITLHAPFVDLSPGSPDETIRNVSLEKITRAIDTARIIPTRSIVVHSGYSDWHFDFAPEKWLAYARASFSSMCERASSLGIDVHVENIFDSTPDTILMLLQETGRDNLKVCFDPGHANLFSSIPLVQWVKELAPHIKEVHLHDNSGKRDEHLPLMEGSINFRAILWALKERGETPVFTLEPHTLEHARRTLTNFRRIGEEVFSPLFQDTF